MEVEHELWKVGPIGASEIKGTLVTAWIQTHRDISCELYS